MPKMPKPASAVEATPLSDPQLLAKRDAYLKVLQGEDILGVVIRAHIYIEHELNDLLDAAVADPAALKALNLDYSGKVILAAALGLDPTFRPMLSCVGKLRNDFAHNLTATLGSQQVTALRTAMGAHFDVAHRSLASTDKKMGNASRKWRQLDATEQLVLMLITIWSGLAIETLNFIRHVNEAQ